ncbi:MAG: HigA family addiction module antitoxin [Bdellovibrionales bacterium]
MGNYPKKNKERKPSHPGRVLKELWLDDLGYSQTYFAELLSEATEARVQKSTMQTKLSEIISGKRAMSADFAVLISKVLGTKPKMWMTLQIQLDIWLAERKAA